MLKIFEKTLLPLTLVIAARLGTVFALSLVLGANWGLAKNYPGLGILFSNINSTSSITLISSLVDFSSILVCSVGFTWVLFRYLHLNKDALHPSAVVKIFKHHQGSLVEGTDAFYEVGIWLAISWAVLLTALGNSLSGTSNFVVVGFGLAVNLVLTSSFWVSIGKDFKPGKRK